MYDVHFDKGTNDMLLKLGVGGLASVLDVQSLLFLLKKIGFGHDQTLC